MYLKRLTLAALIAGSAMWLLAGLWHTLIMASFYRQETEATHEGTGIILVAYLVLGAGMAYLYPRQEHRRRPVVEGLIFGMVIGLLWVFPHELAMAGAHGESIAYVLKNAAWHLVEQGLGGVVVALIYGRELGVALTPPAGPVKAERISPVTLRAHP